MTPSLRQFVDEHARWFRGASAKTDRTLDTAEQQLGVQLPSDLRSILSEYGYWHATGISSLDETVTNTLAARQHVGLPHQFIVLYDHHDGGVILLDTAIDPKTEQHRVYNAAWESVPDQIADEIVYDSYLDYVRDVLSDQRDFISDADIDYRPR